MARVPINNHVIDRVTGLDRSTIDETDGDAVNNHTMANDGQTWIEVRNSNGASTARVLTVRLPGTKDGQAYTPKTYSIAAGKTISLGPWPADIYGGDVLMDVAHAELKLASFSFA